MWLCGLLGALSKMRLDPIGKCISFNLSSSQRQENPLLFVHRGLYLIAVEHQKYLHGCVRRSLVPVDKRMIPSERKAQNGSFLSNRRIQILTAEGHAGLLDGGG